MSTRIEIRDALLAKLREIHPTIHIDSWSGEDAAFNEDLHWPAIYLSYEGVEFGGDIEMGATTYNRDPHYTIYFCTRHEQGNPGEDQALNLLEDTEEKLSGVEIAGAGEAELNGGEKQVGVHLGKFLYAQPWIIPGFESH